MTSNIYNIVVTTPFCHIIGNYDQGYLWIEYFDGDIKSCLQMINFEVSYIGFARAMRGRPNGKWYNFNRFKQHVIRKQTKPTRPSSCSAGPRQGSQIVFKYFDSRAPEEGEGVSIDSAYWDR